MDRVQFLIDMLENDRDRFIENLSHINRQLNQRLYRIEKKYSNPKLSTSYFYAQNETGKQKPRYPTNINKLSNMSNDDLEDMLLKVDRKINSKTSSLKGLDEINEKRINESLNSVNNWIGKNALGSNGIERNEWIDFLDNYGGELLNSLDSEQIIEDYNDFVNSGNVSQEHFLETFKKYRSQNDKNPNKGNRISVDYGKVKRELNKINNEVEEQ